jgi:hypothetical protein
MNRFGLTVAILFVLVTAAVAQFTTVTGTVIDPHTVPYAFGTIVPVISIPSGAGTPQLANGTVYLPPTQPSGLDGTGHFTVTVADNSLLTPAGTKWNFIVCSFQGTELPAFGTGSQCFSLAAPITISGTSQDITTQLNAAALPLTVPFNSGGSGGLSCSPTLANSVVYINNSSACTTTNTLGFFNSTLTAGHNGAAAVGKLVANSTTNNFGASLTTDAAGDQIILSANFLGPPVTMLADTSLSPIDYIETEFGVLPTGNSAGWEYHGFGDVQCSGCAAGFKVVNDASTSNTSPGAPVSVSAGSAQGTSSSPGGSVALTAGNSSGGGSADPGGPVTLTAGNAAAGNNLGGDVTFTAGNGHGSGRGGNINLNSGAGSPAGQILCNGSPCATPGIQISSGTTLSGSTTPIGASAQTWLSSTVTMPASGCPCRAFVSYGAIFSSGNSGVMTLWVEDSGIGVSTQQFATTQWLTASASATGPGGTGSAFSQTYANSTAVTFNARGFTNAASGISIITTPLGGSTQPSWLNVTVFTSN